MALAHCRARLFRRDDRAVHAGHRRAAEAEFGEFERCAADFARLEAGHVFLQIWRRTLTC